MDNSSNVESGDVFSTRSTALIKGIAIIMMVCNHFFPIPDWIYPSNQFISIPIGSKTLAAYIGGFSKSCVSIYTLLTGVGMYHTYTKYGIGGGYKHTLKKLIPFLCTYWICILFVYIPIMITTGVFNYDLKEVIYNLIGYKITYCKAAWYVRYYIELVVLFPVMLKLQGWIEKAAERLEIRHSHVVALILLVVLSWGIRYFYMTNSLPGCDYVSEFLNYAPITMLGFFMARHQLFEKAANKLDCSSLTKTWKIAGALACYCVMFLGRGVLYNINYFRIDLFIAPAFIFVSWYLLKVLNIKQIENILLLLSKYSVEIWFLHTIFFIGNETLQKVAYWPKVDILILIWTFALLLPIAVLIQKIRIYAGGFIRNKFLGQKI